MDEKIIFIEELRAVFRDMFKLEIKNFAGDVGFLGKMNQTKMNEERLTPTQRDWLVGLGVLTKDKKNFINMDDRTVFSHMVSAIYAGLYGLNFVDVTAHCLETIKIKKGLKPNCNLIEHLSVEETRNFAVALYDFSRKIRVLKNQNKLIHANMNNFYYVADLAFSCGLNAKNNCVQSANSDYIKKTSNKTITASNILKNIIASLDNKTFSYKNFHIPNSNTEKNNSLIKQYIGTYNNICSMLIKNGYSTQSIKEIFSSINEGFYQTSYYRHGHDDIITLLKLNENGFSENDLYAQNTKLTFANILLSKFLAKKQENSLPEDIKNIAYKSGLRAREDCQFKLKTSPEFFGSFMQSYLYEKERTINI